MMAKEISYDAATKDQPENYNSIRSIKVLLCLSTSYNKELYSTWNILNTYYLKYYVTMRLLDRSLPRGKFQGFLLAMIFIVSALFYGFYVGYDITFLVGGLMEFTYKLAE